MTIYVHLLNYKCREFETLYAFHARSQRGIDPTFYGEFGTRCSGRVEIRYYFREEVKNYKTGTT